MPSTSQPEYRFDQAEADRAVEFFSLFLRHVKGEWAGTPLELAPWQADRVIRPLFGWKRADGTRKYRTVFVEIPRKNGKSTLAAGVALKLLFGDKEPGAEVYSAATDRDQAAIVFDMARQMVRAHPELEKRGEVYRRSIVFNHSTYKVISADAASKHGYNAHAVILDELHAWRSRELFDVLTSAQGSRRQPVVFIITTAGYDKASICYEEYQYACQVRDGIIEDPSYLPVIFETEADEDWEDPAVWAKANPGLGESLKPEYLQDRYTKAKSSLSEQNAFRRLHLNQWTEQETRWLDMDHWAACGSPVLEADLAGSSCFAGLDLSATTDLTAFVMAFELPDGSFALVPRFWIPQETAAEKQRKFRTPYLDWIASGHVKATPGNVVDYDAVRAEIRALGERFHIRELAIDRWNAAQITTQLGDDGFTVVPFGQGFASMSAPSKEFEKLCIAGQLRHGNHPVLRWMASNVEVKQDPAGNIKPVKPNRERTGRCIDGIVAAVMAIGRATVNHGASVYDTRGLHVL